MLTTEEKAKLQDLILQFVKNNQTIAKEPNGVLMQFWKIQQDVLQDQIRELQAKENS